MQNLQFEKKINQMGGFHFANNEISKSVIVSELLIQLKRPMD